MKTMTTTLTKSTDKPVDPEVLRELLDYDPSTGVLRWRERDRKWFKSDRSWKSWNGKHAGKEAFTALAGAGYRHGSILGTLYRAHQIVWAMVFDEWVPEGFTIDHINRVKTDNRLNNLRLATMSENCANRIHVDRSASGYRGVSYHKASGRWQAYVKHEGHQHYVGLFDNPEDAAKAYDQLAATLHGEFAHLNFGEV